MGVPLELVEAGEYAEPAKAEWLRIVAIMGDKIDKRDRSLLIDYCLTHAEVIALRRTVQFEGHKLVGPKGGEYINPTVNLLISRQTHLASLRRDLYFTPKSRIEKQAKSLSKGKSIVAGIRDEDDGED